MLDRINEKATRFLIEAEEGKKNKNNKASQPELQSIGPNLGKAHFITKGKRCSQVRLTEDLPF